MSTKTTWALANAALRNKDYKKAVALFQAALSQSDEMLKPQIRFGLEIALKWERRTSRTGAGQEAISSPSPIFDIDAGEPSLARSKSTLDVDEKKGASTVADLASHKLLLNVSRPRIIFCTHDLKLQGAPKSLFEVITGLERRGSIQAVVVSPYDGPLRSRYEALGIPLAVIEGGNIWNSKTGQRYRRAVKLFQDAFAALRPDAVFANTFTMFHAAFAAKSLGIPAIVNARESESPETFFDAFPKDIKSQAYQTVREVDRVIFVANATRKQWEFANVNDSFVVIHNALPKRPPEMIGDQTERRKMVRSSWGIADSDTVFTCVGTVTPRKGQLDIIKAFLRLTEAEASRSRLLILGMSNNQYSLDLQKIVAGMPPSHKSRVNLLPDTKSPQEASLVHDVYLAADVFILSSRLESYPRVILEAMAYDLPVITTPCFGVVEQVRDGVEALCYSEGDSGDLAKHMKVLINSSERRSELAVAVRRRLTELGTYDHMLSAYEKQIHEVLSKKITIQTTAKLDNSVLVSSAQNMMKLSVCIVSCRSENVERLLKSLEYAGLPNNGEVLVSWNGEGSPAFHFPLATFSIKVIENRPYNFAANNNVLARMASGEFLLFVNDDVVLDPGSVRALIYHSENNSHAMVGPNLRYPTGVLQHAGVFFNDRWEPFHRYKHAVHYLHHAVSKSCKVPAITGACILLSRTDFEILTGFDENFQTAGEDIDLCVRFQETLGKSVHYCAEASGIHLENATRRDVGERLTPPGDLLRIRRSAARLLSRNIPPDDGIRLSIHTEEPGWILHRKATEIKRLMKSATINEDTQDVDIHYYINYGYYFRSASHAKRRGLKVANFTHLDPALSEQFREAARIADHCVSVSEETTKTLLELGVPKDKITTILVGADVIFEPKLTLGLVGRVYEGGRKGEHLVKTLLEDDNLMTGVRIVSTSEDWGVPVWRFEEQADFYRSIDYLLIPSLVEGGPVPFMEALACGTIAIAPQIGVIPQFPHIPYQTGNSDSLKKVILQVKSDFLATKRRTSSHMAGIDWLTWALKHQQLFQRLLTGKTYVQTP